MSGPDTIVAVPPKTLFSDKLSEAIKLRWDGTQAELADRIGVSRQSLQQYLTGSTPKPNVLYLLASALTVPLNWLVNEEDERMDPPPPPIDVERAPTEALIAEGEKRYLAVCSGLFDQITAVEKSGDAWERAAMRVLMPHDPASAPEALTRALAAVERLDFLIAQFDQLKRFYHERMRLKDGRSFNYTDPEDASPVIFQSAIDELKGDHPGIAALVEYLVARSDDGVFDVRAQLKRFWNERAPFHLARLVDHPALKDYEQRDEMKAQLAKFGYIDKAGEPVPFPEFQPFPMVPKDEAKRKPRKG